MWLWHIRDVQYFELQGLNGPYGLFYDLMQNAGSDVYGSKLKLCHIITMVVVHSGCSGVFDPRSEMERYLGTFYDIVQKASPTDCTYL